MPQPPVNSAKPIHIFKPGRRITSAGEAINFSEADLAASAQAYDPKLHEAPLVIGHPQTDDPAKGWVARLLNTARGLFVTPRHVDPAFAEQVNGDVYGKVSAKFYRPNSPRNPVPGVWYLRHVGFLGAQPPAVKGLDDPAFADVLAEEEDCVLFQEAVPAASDAPASADPTPSEPTPATPAPAATTESDSPSEPTPEENTVTPEEAKRLADENAALTQRVADMEAATAKQEADRRHADNVAFAEQLSNDARIKADHVPLVAAMLDRLQTPDGDGNPVEFGEGDAAEPMHQAVRALLGEMAPNVEFGEVATGDRVGNADSEDDVEYAEGTDPDRIALDKRIRAHMKQHSVDYHAAAMAVGSRA